MSVTLARGKELANLGEVESGDWLESLSGLKQGQYRKAAWQLRLQEPQSQVRSQSNCAYLPTACIVDPLHMP